MTAFRDRLARIAEAIAMAALGALALVQLWQVAARYLFNQSIAWSEPLSALLLALLMGFAGAAAVHGQRHFRFAWFGEQLPPRHRITLGRLIDALLCVVCLALALKAGAWAWDGIAIKQAGIALPVGSNYVVLAIGMALAAGFAAANALDRAIPNSAAETG
jgi:TRAP-type C4-dicarboxylate transport system permease small subunit